MSISNREGEDAAPLPEGLNLKSATIKLYGAGYSPPCCKVSALLNFYDIPFQAISASPGQKLEDLPDDSYGKIPKLLINDRQINDSAVIVRMLTPFLAGAPLTEKQVELETLNNIRGMLGALEIETACSYRGIRAAASYAMSDWGKTWTGSVAKHVLPYVAGLISPIPYLITSVKSIPHGSDGTSKQIAKRYVEALGASKFFHGEAPGPLDISLYGGITCFVQMGSPQAKAALASSGLQEWYDRCDAKYQAAGKPLFV